MALSRLIVSTAVLLLASAGHALDTRAILINHDLGIESTSREKPVLPRLQSSLRGRATVLPHTTTPGPSPAPWKPGDPVANKSIPLVAGINYLHQMLQMAVEVEHSVVPPYLTALYSIIPDATDNEVWVQKTIRGVVIEEMLHMTIACNVLNAVGGHPAIDRQGFVPHYPDDLPALNITVGIQPFSIDQAIKFRLIERPTKELEEAWATAQVSKEEERLAKFGVDPNSITFVYDYITNLMAALCKQHGESSVFVGNSSLQVEVHSPSIGESVTAVLNLSSAIAAISSVVEQGAGVSRSDVAAGPLGGQFAHFARFEEIYTGRMYLPNDTAASGPTGSSWPANSVNWTKIYKFQPNPSLADHPVGSTAYNKLAYFAANYTDLLSELHDVFNGNAAGYIGSLEKMYVMAGYATDLMKTPDPRHPEDSGMMLGPLWLWDANRSRHNNEWHGYNPQPLRPIWGY